MLFDNIAVIIILSLACVLIVRRIYMAVFKNNPVCGCGCTDHCSGCQTDTNKGSIPKENNK